MEKIKDNIEYFEKKLRSSEFFTGNPLKFVAKMHVLVLFFNL